MTELSALSSVLAFVSGRLPALDESRFAILAHRRVPDVLRRKANVAYFSVPLSAGIGAAVCCEPRGPATRSGPRPLVLLVHGLGDDCTFPHWHWIDQLIAQDLAVLSIEWDGHGPAGGSHLDFQSATRSLPLLLQKLFGNPGQGLMPDSHKGPPLFLMGHSTGAAYALICASRPEAARQVKGVIAISPTVSARASDYRRLERFEFARPGAWLGDFIGRIPYYGVRAMLPRPRGARHETFPLRVKVGLSLADQLESFLRETFAVRRILRQVEVPVLWLHGARDRFAPYADAQPLMSEIPSALFVHVDRARGHVRMAFSQSAPQYAARFIARCLNVRMSQPAAQVALASAPYATALPSDAPPTFA